MDVRTIVVIDRLTVKWVAASLRETRHQLREAEAEAGGGGFV
jgi:Erythronolide synthase docking.